MADVKWIKITTDIFDDEKIAIIESLPEGDSIIVIWFKLLCLAGKTNNNGVFVINDKLAYTDEMLAIIFRRKVATVRLALKVFQEYGMVDIVEGVITIPKWGNHQNLDSIEKKKEYQRSYMQNYREKQRQIACKTNCNTNSKSNCNTNVSRTDIDKDIEEDKDKDIYSRASSTADEVKEIVDYLNQAAGTNYKSGTGKTVRSIKARLNEGFTVDDFKAVIDKKVSEWRGSDMEKYIRPETLFGSKFEGYLNQQTSGNRAPATKGNFWDEFDKLKEEYDDEG